MKKPFLLILSTSGGAGHIRAAEALLEAARSGDFSVRAEHFDCLDFTSRTFKSLYGGSYLSMVNHLPEFWGYLYAGAERKPYSKKGLVKIFDHFNYARYLRALRQLKPDAILCTHFLPYISISDRAKNEAITAPFFASTTDFDVHQLWIDSIVRRYYVFHDESAWQLSGKGVPRDSISVKGIPVGAMFTTRGARAAARRTLGVSPARFTVFLLSGGFGVGRILEIAESVSVTLGSLRDRSFNLLVVCGRNEELKTNLEKRAFPPNVRTKIFGFVDNIGEMMDASDILVSKSGGLTSAEAMAKHLPMIIVDPIPGQESRNASILAEHGAAMMALDYHNLQYKLRRAIEDPDLLKHMRESAATLGRPFAARDIIRDVLTRLAEQ